MYTGSPRAPVSLDGETRPTSFLRGAAMFRRTGSRPMKRSLAVSTANPRPHSSGVSGPPNSPPEAMSPASTRSISRASVPMGFIPTGAPASMIPSQTAGAEPASQNTS